MHQGEITRLLLFVGRDVELLYVAFGDSQRLYGGIIALFG